VPEWRARRHANQPEGAPRNGRQVGARGVTDEQLLATMRRLPREAFVPSQRAEFAYEDSPLPIEARETISRSYIAMIEAAAIGPDDRFVRFADARIVLLGGPSHETSEFYRALAAITRRPIEAHGRRYSGFRSSTRTTRTATTRNSRMWRAEAAPPN
jgi:hypothetical protein